MTHLAPAVGACLVACAAACTGSISEPEPSDPGDDAVDPAAACDEADPVAVGPTPLRRLTRVEYDNTVRDLLGDDARLAREFTPDEAAGGFDANAGAAVSQLQLEDYYAAAEELAAHAVDDRLDEWLSCDPAATACVRPFLAELGARAFRRPLADDELGTFVELYESGRAAWGAVAAIELALQALLTSPQFLYHVELGEPSPSPAGAVALTGYEVASRLSYFLWSSMPDEALFSAAAAGDLATAAGVAQQARRMVDDPRALATIESFHGQWLKLDELEELVKDDELFPAWSPELGAAMRDETLAFVTRVIRDGDAKLATLLTAPFTYTDDAALAELYGAAGAPDADGRLALDPDERAGLLTQGSFLAGRAHATEVSWVHRGKFVRERLLCDPLAPPPPGVEVNMPNDTSRVTNPECMGCHLQMDPIGRGFDRYGPIGERRAVDDYGAPVADTGEILDEAGRVDVDGPFTGVVGLASMLAGSGTVRDCVAREWFRFAARRMETADDACSVASLRDAFAASGGDIRELLVAITTTDAFRHRTSIAP
jgi:hypothetical protein